MYEITKHALQRFSERVTSKYDHKPNFDEHVQKWVTQSMKASKYLGEGDRGVRMYRVATHIIILDPNEKKVVTIKPDEGETELYKTIDDTISQTIKKTVQRMLRPLSEKQYELLINIHTLELKRLRVHNPETKSIISVKIDEAHEELDKVKQEINFHSNVAYKYGVKIEETL